MNIKRLAHAVLAASVLFTSAVAGAQEWPEKPIRMIVPFGPGSTPDIVARFVAHELSPRLGQPVVVENRSGAGGNIGTGVVAKAEPDGYTMGITISGPLAANTLLRKNMQYDPKTEIDPITIAATQASVLVVSKDMGVSSMEDLLAKLRANPGKFNYSSMGMGSISHMAVEAVAARSGTKVTHVPYAGSTKAAMAVLKGETHMAILPAAAVMPHIKDGKLVPLAVATAKRASVLPKVPTLEEAGVKDVQADAWMGFILPANTPEAIQKRLHGEIVDILQSKEMKEKLAKQYMEPVAGSAADMRATVKGDLMRWKPIIEKNNISLD